MSEVKESRIKKSSNRIREIDLDAFVSQLKRYYNRESYEIIFFIGAGCSISSGIPGASDLTKTWIKQLKKEDAQWVEVNIPHDYKNIDCAKLYSKVLKRLHTSSERRLEIQNIVLNTYPDIGYRILSCLLSHKVYGKSSKIVLTTNFDDLLTDAFYLNNFDKPIVILPQLAKYIDNPKTRTMIIKLHGDAMIDPINCEDELEKLSNNKGIIKSIFKNISIIIFIGYGGNDTEIIQLFKELRPVERVYWVRDRLPDSELSYWLEDIKAFHVNHLDFNELMLQIFTEFELGYENKGLEGYFAATMNQIMNQLDLLGKMEFAKKMNLCKALKKIFSHEKSFMDSVYNCLLGNESQIIAWKLFKLELEKCNAKEKNDFYEEEGGEDCTNPYILCDYATYEWEKDDRTKAHESFKKANAILEETSEGDYKKETLQCFTKYAEFLASIGQKEAAIELFEKVHTSKNHTIKDLLSYASFLIEDNKNADEQLDLIKSSNIRGQNDETKFKYAQLLYDNNNFEEAKVFAERLCRKHPQEADYLHLCACIYSQLQESKSMSIPSKKIREYFMNAASYSNYYPEYVLDYTDYLIKNNTQYEDIKILYEKAKEYKGFVDECTKSRLLGKYALFTEKALKNDEEAYKLYKSSYNWDQNNWENRLNYVCFMLYKKENVDKASKLLENEDNGNYVFSLFENLIMLIIKNNIKNKEYKSYLKSLKAVLSDNEFNNISEHDYNLPYYVLGKGKTDIIVDIVQVIFGEKPLAVLDKLWEEIN